MFIYELSGWPTFTFDQTEIFPLLIEVRNLQGRILGRMESLGFELKEEATLETITLDVLKSSEIEGAQYNPEEVRSSIARRLGIHDQDTVKAARDVEGVVEMMLDATQHYSQPLTAERLKGWHAAMFPTGYSGMRRVNVGGYRNDAMEVVSGPLGKERVHLVAVPHQEVEMEMDFFLEWFNYAQNNAMPKNSGWVNDPVLNAAIAHLWFLTIHPFDDGNGRIARAITDMQLARSDGSSQRFYSMSSQILKERKQYYKVLEKTQRGNLDITEWLVWFLECLQRAILSSDQTLDRVLQKARFWERHRQTVLNQRQVKVLNKILDGSDMWINTRRWTNLTKVSRDTALRDMKDLIGKGILAPKDSGGRSTAYRLVIPEG